jgi:hypothetical protein
MNCFSYYLIKIEKQSQNNGKLYFYNGNIIAQLVVSMGIIVGN